MLFVKKFKPWLIFILAPFAAFFAAGARFGWWFIEKDTGRLLRDTGKITEQRELMEAALLYGLIAGLTGAAIGFSIYGLFVLVKRAKPN